MPPYATRTKHSCVTASSKSKNLFFSVEERRLELRQECAFFLFLKEDQIKFLKVDLNLIRVEQLLPP